MLLITDQLEDWPVRDPTERSAYVEGKNELASFATVGWHG